MTSKLQYADVMAVLEDAGCRITDARRSIVALLKGKKDGFSAEEINEELLWVGRATVYRTLKLLIEKGVLCKLFTVSGSAKYAVSKFGHHHHTVCVACGTVGEFRDAPVERLLRSVEQYVEGEIVGHILELHIMCPTCVGKRVRPGN